MAGLNPPEGMDIRPFCFLCVVKVAVCGTDGSIGQGSSTVCVSNSVCVSNFVWLRDFLN
jgi:hypothetical protein